MAQTAPLEQTPKIDRPVWPAAGSPRHRLDDLAARLSRTLALSRALIQSGRTLDLTGVEDGVGLLCAQTLDLPPDEARALLPALHDLLWQLDQVSAAVRASLQSARRC